MPLVLGSVSNNKNHHFFPSANGIHSDLYSHWLSPFLNIFKSSSSISSSYWRSFISSHIFMNFSKWQKVISPTINWKVENGSNCIIFNVVDSVKIQQCVGKFKILIFWPLVISFSEIPFVRLNYLLSCGTILPILSISCNANKHKCINWCFFYQDQNEV